MPRDSFGPWPPPLLMTLQLGQQLMRLRRLNLTVPQIAGRLGLEEQQVLQAHAWMGVPLTERSEEPAPRLSKEERAAMLDRMPKRMQDRVRKQDG